MIALDFSNARTSQGRATSFMDVKPGSDAKRGPRGMNKPGRKVNQTLRLDPDVLAAYRDGGSGWHTRINAVLREHMPKPDKE